MTHKLLFGDGYTLVELLVVIVLISISMGLMVMSFGKALPGATIRSTVREFSTALRYSKGLSQIKGKPYEVEINFDEMSYTYKDKRRFFPKGVKVYAIDPTDGEISSGNWLVTFFPEGGATGGEVVLYDHKREFHIFIDPVVGSVVSMVPKR